MRLNWLRGLYPPRGDPAAKLAEPVGTGQRMERGARVASTLWAMMGV